MLKTNFNWIVGAVPFQLQDSVDMPHGGTNSLLKHVENDGYGSF